MEKVANDHLHVALATQNQIFHFFFFPILFSMPLFGPHKLKTMRKWRPNFLNGKTKSGLTQEKDLPSLT